MYYDSMELGDDSVVYGKFIKNEKVDTYELFDNIFISEVYTDLVTGEQEGKIVMEHSGKRFEKIIPLKDVKSENIINTFKAFGFRCTIRGARVIDEWFSYYAKQNAKYYDSYTKVGYLNTLNGGKQYCLPRVVKALYRGGKDYGKIGEREEWLELVQELHSKNPMLALPLAVGLSAPVVARLRYHVGTENLLVSFSGLTSTGKTTTLKLMASMWGKPYLGEDGLLDNMNTTLNALQSKLNHIQGAPVFLDETSSNRNLDYQQMTYELADGLSKARANSQGDAREQATWNTTIMLTTEGALVNSLETAGSKARLLDIPLKFYNDKESVEKVRLTVPFCYGHMASRFVKFLEKRGDKELLEIYQKSASRLREKYKGDFPQEYYRMLDRMALIDTTAQVMQKMKSFKFLKQEDFDAAYAELAKNYQHIILDEDQALFETLSNKVLENLQRFLRVGFPNQRFDEEWPEGVCFGKIVCAGGRYVAYIMHNVACDWLKLTPAEAKTVFARWKEKRMLVQTSEGRTQYRTNLQGKKVYTYAIELDAETKGHYLDMPVKPKKAKKKSTKPLLEDDGDKKDTKA